MLDLLRRKAQSYMIQIIIVLIALVFIFWGTNTSNQGAGGGGVATVNDAAISIDQFRREYDQALAEQRARFGDQIPQDLLLQLVSRERVLDQLIQRLLLQQGALAAGIDVSDKEIQNIVGKMEVFKRNGAFDQKAYEELLAQQHLSASSYEAGLRSELLSGKTFEILERFAKVTPAMLEERFAHDYQETTLAYVNYSPAAFKDKVAVTDEALAAYFDKHGKTYQTEPQVRISFLAFPFASEAAVDDRDIQKYYQEHLADYTSQERRRARHILIRVEEGAGEEAAKKETAEKLLAQARKGADFATLARKHSEDDNTASEGGDLGFFPRGQTVKPIEEAAFALKKGEISGLVRSPFGYHIIKLEAIEPGGTKTLPQVQAEIKELLLATRGKSLAFNKASEAYNQIIIAGSLQRYAADQGVTLSTTPFFTRQTPPGGLAGDPVFLNAAFTLKQGELSSIVEAGTAFVILFVDQIQEPQIPPFDSVRQRVRADLVEEEAGKLAKSAAESLLASVREGGEFEAAAAATGAKVKRSQPLTRAGRDTGELPATVASAGFALSAAAPYPEQVVQDGDSYYVFKLAERKPANQELFEAKKEGLRQQLLRQQQASLLRAWIDELQEQASITINREYLQ